jgi:3,4-dihydroxy 2-butanone 4-phosphate synthase/GTP cyclohydrolase II
VNGGTDTVSETVERAVADIAAGRPVVVVDDADRENEGDLIFAAERATPELVTLMMLECRGLLCVAMDAADTTRLGLPQMVEDNTEAMGTAFTVSVDAASDVTTGISAADRSRTIRLLADPGTTPDAFVRPGHVFPLRARDGGVLVRPGHTEAAVDLARLAGLRPAGAICEIVNDDGTMARMPELEKFAADHDLALVTIADLITYRKRRVETVERVAETLLPTGHGQWRAYGYRAADGSEQVALVYGDLGDGEDVLVRAHSECLTGDVFGSQRCDCGTQLDAAMARIAERGRGVLLYLRGHEGRGIGLLGKLRAYALQDAGADTVDANLEQGLPADAREYGVGARMLADLGVRSARVLTNNPAKLTGLAGHGVRILSGEPLPAGVTRHNLRYLTTKRDRLGHQLPDLPETAGSAS